MSSFIVLSGICVVWKRHPSVTHHVVSELTLDPSIATSLLSLAKFVKPEWLVELLSCGNSSEPSTSLEYKFSLPSISQHRPDLSPFLPSSLKNHRIWEPSEDRVDMLKALRIVFVGDRGRETTDDYKELVKRGGATYECYPVQSGRRALHNVIAKGKEKGKIMVLIATQSAIVAAIGLDMWEELIQEAKQFVSLLLYIV